MQDATRRKLVEALGDERVLRAVALSAAFITLFAKFWDAPLSANDTALHAGMARRMAETGAWPTPTLYGAPWYDHLPPFLWITAASFRTFGFSAGAARLPHLVLALVAVWAVFEIARLRASTFAGLVAALALTTTEMFWRYAGRVRPDVPMTCFVALALLALVLASERGPRWLVGFAVASGLAIFSKGPMGVAPLVALVVHELAAWRMKERRVLVDRWAPIALLLLVLVPLPWVGYQLLTSNGAWLERYVVHQILWLPRHGGTGERDLLVVPKILFRIYWPWAPLLVAALVELVRRWRTAGAPIIAVAASGLFVALALTLSNRQTEYYLLPAFPAFSVLIGWAVDRWVKSPRARGWTAFTVFAASVVAGVVFTVTPLSPRLGSLEKETGRMAAVIPALRAAMTTPGAKLAMFDLHPDRTEWTLNLWLDLAEKPAVLSGTDSDGARDFLAQPGHVLLAPAERAEELRALAPASTALVESSGLVVLRSN